MQIAKITPSRTVDNAFLQETIASIHFEQFRSRLLQLLNQADEAVENAESEEHLKNLIKPFLNNTNFSEDYYINTKERQDLAIHNGKTGSSSVGVILEAKRPSNKEMIAADDINRKAFHEAILYYLRERIENGNDDIKHIIITDVYRWFIFDAQDFERYFYDSKKLKGWYSEWKQGGKVSSKTQFIYDHLSEFIGESDAEIKATQFDIREFKPLLVKEEVKRDEQKKLVPLFKFFTPTHLLKLPFASDSNNLNKGFYRELLYIMGLQEYKEKGTHYITRLDEGKRHSASLIENTITQLKSLSVLSQISNCSAYGETKEEQLFNVAIQLLITWINRILFLKLLEAQLFKYHREDEEFRFLGHRDIKEYDGLNKLFFQVLAVPGDDRSQRISENYGHIPYLNSSLFDVAEIERNAIRISELEDGLPMPVHARSKIRNREGERLKGESISALEYLLRFLDAYSFNSEGTAEVQQEAKTLINASVLGRIFEKINGYKDGSFFTPGYITEYMCRETIRRAVVQKFNEAYDGWNCETINDLRSKLARHEVPYDKANAIVNITTICDPAVGSGHFLVSALNELITIKHDLRIFVDEDNNRIRDVDISVDNDELRISVGADPFFEYRVHHEWQSDGEINRTVGTDTQRLQKALFREKNILIENCLFGVDINPNSVNICRLRLWVELLKHAYYREDTNFNSLKVLPNIDINIKKGNSLVSRFGLDADLSSVFKKSDYSVDDYKEAVRKYKNTRDRTEKRRLQQYIKDIKKNYNKTLLNNLPINEDLSEARGKLQVMHNADLFGKSKFTKKEIKAQEKEVMQLEGVKAEEESGVFYNQAFEWRFEYPEVLDEEGEFVGFDAVIGNPPYQSAIKLKRNNTDKYYYYLKDEFRTAKGTVDLYIYFYELGSELLKKEGTLTYITPNKYLSVDYGQALREYISEGFRINFISDFSHINVFQEASTYPVIISYNKEKVHSTYSFEANRFIDNDRGLIMRQINSNKLNLLDGNLWGYLLNDKIDLTLQLYNNSIPITDICEINATSTAKEADELHDEISNDGDGFKLINTGTIDPYLSLWGIKELRDQGEDYLTPTIAKNSEVLSENREKLYRSEKIIFAKIALQTEAFLDEDGGFASINTNCIHTISEDIKPKFLLAFCNSKVFQFVYECFFDALRMSGGYLSYQAPYLRKMIIKIPTDEIQNEIESHVDQILTTKQDNPEADTGEQEAEIDQLVYDLYGLSEQEITIVEGSVG